MAKKPTLFLYLCQQEKGSSSASNLAREAERNNVEDATRIVVSQIAMTDAVPRVSTAQCADQDAQGQSRVTGLSTELNLDSL